MPQSEYLNKVICINFIISQNNIMLNVIVDLYVNAIALRNATTKQKRSDVPSLKFGRPI